VSFGITDIPVYVNGRFVYTSAINRVLQEAANIYDATTNNSFGGPHDWPDVFRPTFSVVRDQNGFTNVYINGYEQVTSVRGASDPQLFLPVDATDLARNFGFGTFNNVNVYGVPWIIGAKKGFPNFNEFSMENVVWIERKLQISRPSTNSPLSDYRTNQMYVMSISNSIGVECWNSYSSNYVPSGPLSITVRERLSTALNNLTTGVVQPIAGVVQPTVYTINNTVNPTLWPGTIQPWTNNTPNPSSFDIPLNTMVSFFTNEVYNPLTSSFVTQSQFGSNWNTGVFPLPQFGLAVTNRLQAFILDGSHVIDYVQFAGPDNNTNLNPIIADYDAANPTHGLWNTNFPNDVFNQILYSESPQLNGNLLTANDDRTWVNTPGSTVGQEIASFNAFMYGNPGRGTDPNTGVSYKSTNVDFIVQVPFTPSRYIYNYTSWQANDPLVHYIASDLNFSGRDEVGGLETGWHQWNSSTTNLPANNLGHLNDRYQPWLTQHLSVPNTDPSSANLSIQDPLIYSSDDWNFPSYKLPTVGWLGRVHRGTPWQTVYFKSANILSEVNNNKTPIGLNTWVSWTGDPNTFDAINSAPAQDWQLFDLFSTAPDDNATRGQLSVNVEAGLTNNQAGLAAWSALFSGVMVLSNTTPDTTVERNQFVFPRLGLSTVANPIQPAGSYNAALALTNQPPLAQIVAGINQTRTNFLDAGGVLGAFGHVGDILSVPQLTVQSPFLNRSDPIQLQNGISDEMYEWLPQQVMSLLRVSGTPQSPVRYEIYCYGQALKPAPNGIYTGGGGLFGMVTNYQVVAESATRAVVEFNSVLTNVPTLITNGLNQLVWPNTPVPPLVTNNAAVIKSFSVLPPN
jgi:hypothetical protein